MTQRPGVRRTPGRPPWPVAGRWHRPGRRRRRPVRRASAGLTPVRAGAMLAVLLSGAAIYGVANSSAFEYGRIAARRRDVHRGRGRRGGPRRGPRRRTCSSSRRARWRRRSPSSAPSATAVGPRAPARHARRRRRRARADPRLAPSATARYLVDADGQLFARLGETPPAGVDEPAAHRRSPCRVRRPVRRAVDPGQSTSTRRPGSPRSSRATSAAPPTAWLVPVSDANGFVLRSGPDDWAAVFGYYTPSLRTTELIPGQVRLLRSLLLGREGLIERIVLASETDGTYIPKPTTEP